MSVANILAFVKIIVKIKLEFSVKTNHFDYNRKVRISSVISMDAVVLLEIKPFDSLSSWNEMGRFVPYVLLLKYARRPLLTLKKIIIPIFLSTFQQPQHASLLASV